eukprot:Rhum_TRINITY_DN14734_c0_g1::Rhum_TRINITY_DN14734_c0_g1_i1::g.112122::m.112122/K12310/CTBS; Di-N-acetylchitobiase
MLMRSCLVAALVVAGADAWKEGKQRFPESGRLDLSQPAVTAECPCADKSLCNPIAVEHPKEVFGFGPGAEDTWTQMDWTQVTTVAWAKDPKFVCIAHQHKARVVAGAPHMNLTKLGTDAAARAAWVQATVAMVQSKFLDGVTFDFENPLAPGSPEAGYYVTVVEETTEALKKAHAGYQTSVCVAWSPFNIDGRFYDLVGLSKASDFLYVMMYDTRSQIFEQCIAAANAAVPMVDLGVRQYTQALGIPPQKLILGLPWYGYDYPCLPGTDKTAEFCNLELKPFRGVNCSDAAGTEIEFSEYMARLNAGNTTTGRRWNADVGTPYYNYVKDGVVHQMWIDDAESLKLKYAVAAKYGLRGVGPFTYGDLAYGTDLEKKQAKEMWEALKVYTQA